MEELGGGMTTSFAWKPSESRQSTTWEVSYRGRGKRERERRGGYRFLFNRMKCNQSAGYFDHLPEMPGWKTFWAESLSVKHGIV